MSASLSLAVAGEMSELALELLRRGAPQAVPALDLLERCAWPSQQQVAALERLDLVGAGELGVVERDAPHLPDHRRLLPALR
jgi:hypothetical protein